MIHLYITKLSLLFFENMQLQRFLLVKNIHFMFNPRFVYTYIHFPTTNSSPNIIIYSENPEHGRSFKSKLKKIMM